MGIIAALTANINRDAEKKPEPYAPADFMPDYQESTEAPTKEDKYRQFKRLWSELKDG